MKKSDLQFGALLVPLDFIMLVAAGLAAYAVRFSSFYIERIREAAVTIQFPIYIKLVVGVAVVWLVIFALAGLYNLRTYRKIWDEFAKVLLACSTGILVVVIFIFLNRELFASRFIVLFAWILAVLFVSLARLVAREIQRKMLEKGKGIHRMIIIGDNDTARVLSDFFGQNPGQGLQVVQRFSDFSPDKSRLLAEILQKERVDEVLLADPDLPKDQRYGLFSFIEEYHLGFKYAADMLGLSRVNSETTTIGGVPLVEIKKTPLDGWGRIVKRVFDIIGSLLLIILTSPISLLTILAIRLDTAGPVFYLDYRSGLRGKKFLFYKFRSMRADLCDGEGPSASQAGNEYLKELEQKQGMDTRAGALHKIKHDPRRTGVGNFIRRWSIDELPQFFNVLKGDMSLVGPRPHMTLETSRYERHHKKVFTIKPGITGLGQISGRSDLSLDEEVRLDTYYIENWSLWLDIKILLQTPRAVLASRRAE